MNGKDNNFAALIGIQIAGAVIILAFLVLFWGPWNAVRWIGIALAVIGMAFLFTARVQLGRSFSVTPQARKLVTHGLYSRIRNPIYVFSLLMVVGVLMVVERPWLFVFPVVLLVVQTIRARQEARVLEDKFGEEYRIYRSKTWF